MPRRLTREQQEAAGLSPEEAEDLFQYMSDGEEQIIADSGPSRVCLECRRASLACW